MVGLGVGIDYALFLVTRHRENLALGLDLEESIARAVATAGQVVVFAGGTVVVAILGLAVAGVPFVTAGGIAIALIVAIMVLASISLLPAFLRLAGPWINRLGFRPRSARRRRARGGGAGARTSSRHPWAYALSGTALLLALAAPVLALRMGSPDDGTLPEQRTERRAYDLAAAGFGAGSNGPLVIAVDVARDARVLEPLRRAVRADAGIAAVAPAEVHGGVATLTAFPTTGPQAAATRDDAGAAAGRRAPARARRPRRARPHRRADRDLRRRQRPRQGAPAAVRRRRDRALAGAPDRRLPLAARAAQGGGC